MTIQKKKAGRPTTKPAAKSATSQKANIPSIEEAQSNKTETSKAQAKETPQEIDLAKEAKIEKVQVPAAGTTHFLNQEVDPGPASTAENLSINKKARTYPVTVNGVQKELTRMTIETLSKDKKRFVLEYPEGLISEPKPCKDC